MLTKRLVKGSPLTFLEMDDNLDYLESLAKPKATSNQTVTLVPGTLNVADAFAALDALNYKGTTYTGTINVPVAYPFTAADALPLFGRKDIAWFNIASSQFPTSHSFTGNIPANMFGFWSVLFGFLNCTIGSVVCSVDMSASTNASTHGLFMVNTEYLSIGSPLSADFAQFISSGGAPGVMLQNTDGYAVNIESNALQFVGGRVTAAKLRLSGSVAGVQNIVNDNDFMAQANLQLGADVYGYIQRNGGQVIRITNDPSVTTVADVELFLEGRLQLAATGGYSVRPRSGNYPFKITGTSCILNSMPLQPQDSDDGLFICDIDNGTGASITINNYITVDTSVSVPYGLLFDLDGSTGVTANIHIISGIWAGSSLYGLDANRPYNNSVIHDASQPGMDRGEYVTTLPFSGPGIVTANFINNWSDLTLTEDLTIFGGFVFGVGIGPAREINIIIRQDGTGGWLVTWPASFVWAGGVPGNVSSAGGAVDLLTLRTVDGGTTWLANLENDFS